MHLTSDNSVSPGQMEDASLFGASLRVKTRNRRGGTIRGRTVFKRKVDVCVKETGKGKEEEKLRE